MCQWQELQNKKPREGEEDPELVEEIKVARENLGRYTRKISQEYEEESAVRMEDLRQSLISLLNVVNYITDQLEITQSLNN